MKYIFEEIINNKEIFVVIETHFEDDTEREHMKNVVSDIFHHKLMDAILDELNEEQKAHFLAEISDQAKHESLFNKLREWVEDLETKLHLRAKEAESEMLKLIDVN